MDSVTAWITEHPIYFTLLLGVLVEIGAITQAAFKQIFSHPLTDFPGPWVACLTSYRKDFIELVLRKPWYTELQDLHKRYGPVVRIGPNELHFEDPQAYHDIYDNSNGWAKEESLDQSPHDDHSSHDSNITEKPKERKDAFRAPNSAAALPLVIKKVDSLCEALTKLAIANKPVDLHSAFGVMNDHAFYRSITSTEAYKDGATPEEDVQDEQSEALTGANDGADILLVAVFQLLKSLDALAKVKSEVTSAWPNPASSPPPAGELEKLSHLNAYIKEALRLASGSTSSSPRIVPEGNGAKIAGTQVPGDTIVSINPTLVHYNARIFPEPFAFKPERWLQDSSLDKWLVVPSKELQTDLGSSLACLELRYALAAVIRRFDFKLDASSPERLVFSPGSQTPQIKGYITLVTA